MDQRIVTEQAIQWLSRTLAIVMMMVAPGFAGRALDRRWGTQFLTPAGFLLGTLLATAVLVVLSRKLTQPSSKTDQTAKGSENAVDEPSSDSSATPQSASDER